MWSGAGGVWVSDGVLERCGKVTLWLRLLPDQLNVEEWRSDAVRVWRGVRRCGLVDRGCGVAEKKVWSSVEWFKRTIGNCCGKIKE